MGDVANEMLRNLHDDLAGADVVEEKYLDEPLPDDPMKTTLGKYGIKTQLTKRYLKDPDGFQLFDDKGNPRYVLERKVLSAPPDWYNKAVALLSGYGDCFFDGCEEILAAFNAEKFKGGKECKSCELGALIRKYLDKVYEKLSPAELNRVELKTTPPAIVKNEDTLEVHRVERKEAPNARVLGDIPEDLMERLRKIKENNSLILKNFDGHQDQQDVTGAIEVSGPDGESQRGAEASGEEL